LGVVDSSGFLLAEGSTPFNIDATVSITNPVLGIIPRFTHVGATETITTDLSLVNGSNINSSLTVEHEIKTPSNTVLNSGVTSLVINSEVLFVTSTLTSFVHTFTESGEYPIRVRIFNGTELLATVNGAIPVAPAIRIEPNKTVTPSTVIPDGDKRIRVEIRLEGVEQKP
jgi:hypothetical protein